MTKAEIYAEAEKNGYALDGKEDGEILKDPEFFKAAFLGKPPQKLGTCSGQQACPKCGTTIPFGASSSIPEWAFRLLSVAMSAEAGADVEVALTEKI